MKQKEDGQEKKQSKKERDTGKAQIIRFVIIAVLAACVILACYIRLTNQSKNSAKDAEENMTEVEILKQYDMQNDYPSTARDVVKLQCRFMKSIYNESLEESELSKLNEQTRVLYAGELLNENPESEQFANLKRDVEDFQSASKIYVNYTVDSENNVKYSKENGQEYAIVYVTCGIKESGNTNAVVEEYVLLKEDGQWKILGWQSQNLSDDTSDTTE